MNKSRRLMRVYMRVVSSEIDTPANFLSSLETSVSRIHAQTIDVLQDEPACKQTYTLTTRWYTVVHPFHSTTTTFRLGVLGTLIFGIYFTFPYLSRTRACGAVVSAPFLY